MQQQIKKIINIINNVITHKDYEAIERYSFTNKGVIAIQQKDKFGDLAQVHFEMQRGYAMFRLQVANKELIRKGREKDKYTVYYCSYTDTDAFNEFIEDLNTRVLAVI